ncbi:phage tail assembly chaperone [Pseudomonas frederiksbergensis]|uniref:phage tail assembly chaperone n=1 Tax=Pseudomonas frederiksbergensis TaxID=104087 RepID=UPI003D25BEB2
MAIYARVEDGVAVELIDTGDYAITQLFAPSFITSMVRVPDGVVVELGAPIGSGSQTTAPLSKVESAPAIDTLNDITDESVGLVREWRQSILSNSQWLLNRHRDEQELGRVTSLTAKEYLELLEYRQALRDWPACANYPTAVSRPQAPDCLADAFDADSNY